VPSNSFDGLYEKNQMDLCDFGSGLGIAAAFFALAHWAFIKKFLKCIE
jgi:hypothetical protein